MMTNYYSMSEFKQLDTHSMRIVILKSYNNDANILKNELQNNLEMSKIDMDYFVDINYFINNISKHINDMIDYYDYSLLCGLYRIFIYSKNNEDNVYITLNKMYKHSAHNVCLTKTSDIISLFIKIQNNIVIEGGV